MGFVHIQVCRLDWSQSDSTGTSVKCLLKILKHMLWRSDNLLRRGCFTYILSTSSWHLTGNVSDSYCTWASIKHWSPKCKMCAIRDVHEPFLQHKRLCLSHSPGMISCEASLKIQCFLYLWTLHKRSPKFKQHIPEACRAPRLIHRSRNLLTVRLWHFGHAKRCCLSFLLKDSKTINHVLCPTEFGWCATGAGAYLHLPDRCLFLALGSPLWWIELIH